MNFMDDFDIWVEDRVYNVHVEGNAYKEDGKIYYDVYDFSITDEQSNLVTSANPDFEELIDEIYGKDYGYATESEGLDDDYSDMW